MKYFIIYDNIIREPASEALLGLNARKVSLATGVDSYEIDDALVYIINPQGFSSHGVAGIINRVSSQDNLFIVAPSVIQFFASSIKHTDSIYHMINKLSQNSVVVKDSAVFRMTRIPGDNKFKHELSYSALPSGSVDPIVGYINSDNLLISEETLTNEFNEYAQQMHLESYDLVERVSLPLIFYLAGLNAETMSHTQVYEVEGVNTHGFNRLSFGELMLRFPSRKLPNNGEKEFIEGLIGNEHNIDSIWQHNRAQWEEIRLRKLPVINKLANIKKDMPEPTNDTALPDYHQYNHLLMSGFNWVVGQLGGKIPQVQYIGVPVLARNGVPIPIGVNGIIKELDAETFSNDIEEQIESHLVRILSCKNIAKNKENQLQPIV